MRLVSVSLAMSQMLPSIITLLPEVAKTVLETVMRVLPLTGVMTATQGVSA